MSPQEQVMGYQHIILMYYMRSKHMQGDNAIEFKKCDKYVGQYYEDIRFTLM